MIAIFKRELRAYFLNPTGFVFLGFFLLVTGIFFAFGNVLGRSSDFPNLVGSVHFMFVIAVPILTMRLFSEEMRQKTDQLLLTSPVTVAAIVLGKYLAALAVFLAVVLVTISYAVVIAIWGDLSVSQSVGAMIGFVLAGSCYVAIGLLISTMTDNQAVSAVATFALLLLLQLVDAIRSGIPQDQTAGLAFAAVLVLGCAWMVFVATRTWLIGLGAAILGAGALLIFRLLDPLFFHGFIAEALGLFSIVSRQQRFTAGIVSLEDVVFMLSAICVVLFLSVRFIEKRRWA
jgi:ABC-2 type transport system permease protein